MNTMTWRLSISQQLFVGALIISCIAVGTISLFYDREAEAAIVQRSFDQLVSVRTLKKSKIEDYFASLRAMLSVLAAHPASVITSAREMRQRYDVQDILILSPQGTIIYAFNNVSRIGSVIPKNVQKEVQRTLSHDTRQVTFTDFMRFHDDAYDSIAAFGVVRIDSSLPSAEYRAMAQEMARTKTQKSTLPLHAGNIMLIQLPVHAINRIMTENEGLGTTGESYLVGTDSLMRTDSRFIKQSSALRLAVKTAPVRSALAGLSSTMQARDYRNIEVLSAFAPLQNGALRWAIIAELDVDEITIPIAVARRRIIAIGIGITLLMAGVSWYAARRVSDPILRLQAHLSAIAQGNLPATPLIAKQRNEIGTMTQELNTMTASLREATLFAQNIGKGKFDAECTPRSDGDILVIALNDMKRELQRLLADEQQQAAQRTLAFIEGEERERARISRDVHDGVGQILTALRFNIARVSDDPIRSELFDLVDDAMAEVRSVSHNLMPAVLVDFGLEAALEHLCTKSGEAAHVRIAYTVIPLPLRLDTAREITVYRIAQEALSNALRYAEASLIALTFRPNADGTALYLHIRDNGAGFDIATAQHGNGLVNMQERAALFGGKVHITSAHGIGTDIVLEIPFDAHPTENPAKPQPRTFI